MNAAKAADKALKPVTGAAKTVTKPVLGALDAVVNAVPGASDVPTINAKTSGVVGSLTSAKTLGPVAGLSVGILGGHAAQKALYASQRGAFGHSDELTSGQNRNRALLKGGLAMAGLGLAAMSTSGAVQYAGLGLAGVNAAHLIQKHTPSPDFIK